MDDPSVPLSVLCTMDQTCTSTTFMSANATYLCDPNNWTDIGFAIAVGICIGICIGAALQHRKWLMSPALKQLHYYQDDERRRENLARQTRR